MRAAVRRRLNREEIRGSGRFARPVGRIGERLDEPRGLAPDGRTIGHLDATAEADELLGKAESTVPKARRQGRGPGRGTPGAERTFLRGLPPSAKSSGPQTAATRADTRRWGKTREVEKGPRGIYRRIAGEGERNRPCAGGSRR